MITGLKVIFKYYDAIYRIKVTYDYNSLILS